MRVREGSFKETSNGGFLHRIRPSIHPPLRQVILKSRRPASAGLAVLADYFLQQAKQTPGRINSLAKDLGLHAIVLDDLEVGWSPRPQAFSFPMRDTTGAVIGIRLRRLDGSKYAVRGSRDGLFIPKSMTHPSRLLICEGPTDTAAILSIGLSAIGRPSCTGGSALVLEFARKHTCTEIVVVADCDEPGLHGADALASQLCLYLPSVRIIQPPQGIKDARAWVNAGATRDDFEAAINEAKNLRISFRRNFAS